MPFRVKFPLTLMVALAAIAGWFYMRALGQTGGNVTRAAALAGVSVRFMQTLAGRHGVRARRRADDGGKDS